MNGVDPSPEDIALENGYFTKHQVKVFCYNQQVVDSLTTSIRHTACPAASPSSAYTRRCPPRLRLPVLDDGRGDCDTSRCRKRDLDAASLVDWR